MESLTQRTVKEFSQIFKTVVAYLRVNGWDKRSFAESEKAITINSIVAYMAEIEEKPEDFDHQYAYEQVKTAFRKFAGSVSSFTYVIGKRGWESRLVFDWEGPDCAQEMADWFEELLNAHPTVTYDMWLWGKKSPPLSVTVPEGMTVEQRTRIVNFVQSLQAE